MKIEIKNFVFHERLSEETNAFNANLYINGHLAAFVSNRGHGDPILFETNHKLPNAKVLLNEAEEYCKTLPNAESDFLRMGWSKTLNY